MNKNPEIPWISEKPEQPCSLGQLLLLCIPAGQTATIPCPVHGEHVVHGPQAHL